MTVATLSFSAFRFASSQKVSNFGALSVLTTHSSPLVMGVIRNTAAALIKGRVGNTTYYVANGQQVARQSKNNSNYGDTASRTESQQLRRVRWANLVNFYKVCQSWMPKAFESKRSNQTDYNRFMQINLNTSTVALTKDMAANGCAVVCPYTCSQGSIQPVPYVLDSPGVQYLAGIVITSAIDATTTIGGLSADIIANNPDWQDGDNLAMIAFFNEDDDRGYPYASSRYYEFSLDANSTELLSTLPVYAHMRSQSFSSGGTTTIYLGLAVEANEFGQLYIHTRKVGGKLYVSSQSVGVKSTDLIDQFSTSTAVQAAIDSYGVQADVPLDPSFKLARLLSITANGNLVTAALIGFPELTGNQTLVVSVADWDSETCWLEHDGIRYTPLAVDGNAKTYLLGDNGNYRLFLNNALYGGFSISGIVVPPNITARKIMAQSETVKSDPTLSGTYNRVTFDGNCINYPYVMTEELPYFSLRLNDDTELSVENFEFVNCINNTFQSSDTRTQMSISVTDATKPAYIMYQGFIVAVFNYSA